MNKVCEKTGDKSKMWTLFRSDDGATNLVSRSSRSWEIQGFFWAGITAHFLCSCKQYPRISICEKRRCVKHCSTAMSVAVSLTALQSIDRRHSWSRLPRHLLKCTLLSLQLVSYAPPSSISTGVSV